jgi:hypothetical protein
MQKFKIIVRDTENIHFDTFFIESDNGKNAKSKLKNRLKSIGIKVSKLKYSHSICDEYDKKMIGYINEFGD